MRVFISQPMRGKTDEEILRERDEAIKEIKKNISDDIEVIDSFHQSAPINDRPLWSLGKSLELLSTADIAYFCRGWDLARGCRIEHQCCLEYGIKIFE